MQKSQQIEIEITELEKSGTPFTLYSFRDELVNFMYKKSVADASRLSMRFYILVLFLTVKVEDKSLLRKLIDENANKLSKLNNEFSKRKKLQKNEYHKLVEQAGLEKVFKNDIIFLLIQNVLDHPKLIAKFSEFFKTNKDAKDEFDLVAKKYGVGLEKFSDNFKSHVIADDRVDEFGEYHDLSKSVYRTIQMRTSRHLDLTLHKYADVKKIRSESPIILEIIQHIDPQIVIDLWTAYGLDQYAKTIWNFGADMGVQGYFFGKGLEALAKKWFRWKNTNGQKNRRGKKQAKKEFDDELEKIKKDKQFIGIVEVLVSSVLSSDEYLKGEVDRLKDIANQLSGERTTLNKEQMDKRIEEVQKQISKLENIKIKTKKRNAKEKTKPKKK